jgi:hypothetical protein
VPLCDGAAAPSRNQRDEPESELELRRAWLVQQDAGKGPQRDGRDRGQGFKIESVEDSRQSEKGRSLETVGSPTILSHFTRPAVIAYKYHLQLTCVVGMRNQRVMRL